MNRRASTAPQPHVVLQGQTLFIEDEAVRVEHRQLSLDDIQLDPSNPRIQHAVKQRAGGKTLTQDELAKLILDFPGVNELFKAVRDNGGLQEPIYVRPDGRVIEGNCRAACYLKLRAARKSDARWRTLPAIVIPNISDRQVAILQGQAHVTGKNKWRAYEKAGHLHTMHTTLGMDAKTIGLRLGMQERVVLRELKAYQTMTEKVLPKLKGGRSLEKWSIFAEFFKNKQLEEYRQKAAHVDEFVKLVLDDKLTRGADVRKLSSILKHAPAAKALKQHGVQRAMSIVGRADPTADSVVFRKLKQAAMLLKELPGTDLQRLRDTHKSRVILKELFAAVKAVAKAADVKLQ